MTLKLGCIADDFTGATDLANMLVRAGMRVVQINGVPAPQDPAPDGIDAVVVALKSRTAPVAEAVAQSLDSARWLRRHGAPMLYFKVCSTFDSTPAGNIGPVAEALVDLTGAAIVPVTPAFPENGRTVYRGHLFVGEQLLSDSPMRQHPLTPMTDANLVRVLQAQLDPARARRVGRVDQREVAGGPARIRERLDDLRRAGMTFAIVDAIEDDHLRALAAAAADLPLVVAGSGLAIGLPANHGLAPDPVSARLPPAGGRAAVVSGSCSAATRAQVADFIGRGGLALRLDPLGLAAGDDPVAKVSAALTAVATGRDPREAGSAPILVYATAEPDEVANAQAVLGRERAGSLVEHALAEVAAALVAAGVRRLVVAGGETSGACVQRLGLRQLRIGPQIDPGVPWCHAPEAAGGDGLHVALKSGNFGGVDFFSRAFDVLSAG
ncbi:MAG: four-carbon acid sugar kinase family protein [Ideonella sp.]|jgi:uncharacterized protein YgbK (DUF1537 family)|nr:four-carbon acid sugar kinase family protein [Ideonella sp.]